MSEEFGRVRELCAAFGTDLGVVLLVSITWGEDKERVWVMRFCWVAEALKNAQPRNSGLGWEDKLIVRSRMKLALTPDPTRVTPGHPAKGGGGQGAHIPSLLRHPSPSSGPGRVGKDVRTGAYV